VRVYNHLTLIPLSPKLGVWGEGGKDEVKKNRKILCAMKKMR